MPVRRAIVVWVAMLALAVTLALRTVHLPSGDAATFQSNAQSAKIQHRNNDAVRWVPVIPTVLLAWSPIPFHVIVVQDEPLRSVFVDAGLNTRPPPQA